MRALTQPPARWRRLKRCDRCFWVLVRQPKRPNVLLAAASIQLWRFRCLSRPEQKNLALKARVDEAFCLPRKIYTSTISLLTAVRWG